MKNIFLSAILSVITLFAFATKPNTDNIRVNTEKSTVKWIGSKISENHEGTINIAKGYLGIEHGTLVSGQVVIDMKSIHTTDMSDKKNQRLDGHLKSKDFWISAFDISAKKDFSKSDWKGKNTSFNT